MAIELTKAKLYGLTQAEAEDIRQKILDGEKLVTVTDTGIELFEFSSENMDDFEALMVQAQHGEDQVAMDIGELTHEELSIIKAS